MHRAGRALGPALRNRRIHNRAVVWTLRVIPFVVIFLAAWEIYIRNFVFDSLYRDTVCNQIVRNFGSRPRRMFVPNCHVSVRSYDGTYYDIDTNEDGFRDRSAAEYHEGAIALVGDSHAEGFALPIEQSLGRQLEARGGGVLPKKILNTGYRGLGPTEEALMLGDATAQYKIDGVIWILTENDVLDEVYWNRRSLQDWSVLGNYILQRVSTYVFGHRYVTAEYLRVVLNAIAMHHADANHYTTEYLAQALCNGVRSAVPYVEKGVPIVIYAIPHGAPKDDLDYFGVHLDHKAYQQAFPCMGQNPIRVVDQRAFYGSLKPYYIPDQYHLNAEGTRLWADEIVRDLRSAHVPWRRGY